MYNKSDNVCQAVWRKNKVKFQKKLYLLFNYLLLFSCSVVSYSLRPQGLQQVSLPCPSPSPLACSNSCPSSQWRHPAVSSSVVPFSSCPQSFPASGSFPVSQLFTFKWPKYWSFSFSIILSMNIQDWFPLGLTGLISLLSKRFSRGFSSTTVRKCQFFITQTSLWSNSHIHSVT